MTNKTLQQILDVLKYTRYNYNSGTELTSSYQDAISRVADESGVTYQTIGDGCRRRLKLDSIGEFSELIRKWLNGDPNPMMEVLKSQTHRRLHPNIDAFFNDNNGDINHSDMAEKITPEKEPTVEFTFKLQESDHRYLKALCEIEDIDELELIETIISDGIKNRMKKVVQNLR